MGPYTVEDRCCNIGRNEDSTLETKRSRYLPSEVKRMVRQLHVDSYQYRTKNRCPCSS